MNRFLQEKMSISEPDGVGPSRVALFQYGGPDADLQADVVGFTKELLTKCDRVT